MLLKYFKILHKSSCDECIYEISKQINVIFNLQSFSQVLALEMLYMTLVTFYKRSTHMDALFDFCRSFYQQTIIFDFTILYIE